MQSKRLFFGLGAGALAVVMSGLVMVGGVGMRPGDSVYLTDGPSYSDIADLTKDSKAVAHVKILSAGKSYTVPFDAPVVQVVPPHTDQPNRSQPPSSNIPIVSHQDAGILHTDFTVEVLDNVRGAGLKKGDHIVVTQLGGVQQNGAIASAEHDRLMQVDDQEVLFLKQDAKSGKFFTTGGGQGRFKVEKNNT